MQAHATTQGCFSVVILRYSRTVWQNHCSHFLALTEKLLISLLCKSPGGWVRRKIYRGNQVFMVFPFHFHKTPPTDVIYCFCCKCCLLGATGISNAVLTREMVKTQWGSKQSPPQNPPGRWGTCTHTPAQIKDRNLPSPLTTGSQYLEKLSTAYTKEEVQHIKKVLYIWPSYRM